MMWIVNPFREWVSSRNMNTIPNSKTLASSFVSGQTWAMGDSQLKISLVGKTLVHYKHYRGVANASPVFLSSKIALGKFLKERRATLMEVPILVKPGNSRGNPLSRKTPRSQGVGLKTKKPGPAGSSTRRAIKPSVVNHL